jgi:hypothetical protein
MTESELFDLYVLQSENVRALAGAINGLSKDINLCIRRNNDAQVSLKTKMLALMYSAWSEAQFIQITYTPHGFSFSEIDSIKKKKDDNGIGQGWRYMLDLAMEKVGDKKKRSDLRARLDELLELVKIYIEPPSVIRNKIAHGQWINAFNRDNTKKNSDATDAIRDLDPVVLMKMFEIHRYFGYIVRDLIQSPAAGMHHRYWNNIVNLENYQKKTKDWSLASKRPILAEKPIQYKLQPVHP